MTKRNGYLNIKGTLTAYQASRRGGILYCRMEQERVALAGEAALYSVADIYIPMDKSGE